MTAKDANQKVNSLLAERKLFAVVFLLLFLLGYNVTLSVTQPSGAAPTTGQPIPPPVPPQPLPPFFTSPLVVPGACINPLGGEPCEGPPGMANEITIAISEALKGFLSAAAHLLESWLYTYMQATLVSEYHQLEWLERSMVSWWDTMWYYNLLPSLQEMTRQLNVEVALQAQQLHAYADADAMMETSRTYAKHGREEQERHPSEQVCVAATGMGAFSRTTAISRLMRQAWEAKSLAPGLNQKNDLDGNPNPGATSIAGMEQQRYKDWRNIFCDPDGNGGNNDCGNGTNENLRNMDVLPVKFLFNNLTINVNDKTEGKNLELGLEYLINNLVGLPAMEAISLGSLDSAGGKESYLLRRSYLARYAAVRSVPDMIAGWRMPGGKSRESQMNQWVVDLRQSGGLPAGLLRDTQAGSGGPIAGGMSTNPSYKEIMHALSIDRFNNGLYAAEMMTDPAKIDMEKLNVSVFYLMQLRDYYELLERTALTLAVQVALLADQQHPGNPNAAAPLDTSSP